MVIDLQLLHKTLAIGPQIALIKIRTLDSVYKVIWWNVLRTFVPVLLLRWDTSNWIRYVYKWDYHPLDNNYHLLDIPNVVGSVLFFFCNDQKVLSRTNWQKNPSCIHLIKLQCSSVNCYNFIMFSSIPRFWNWISQN